MEEPGQAPFFFIFSKPFGHRAKNRLSGETMTDKILVFYMVMDKLQRLCTGHTIAHDLLPPQHCLVKILKKSG